MTSFAPENDEQTKLEEKKEPDKNFNAYNDLLKVANLSVVEDLDETPPSDLERAEAIRNLQAKGYDMSLIGARLVQGNENGKEMVRVIVESAKQPEFNSFVKEMKAERLVFLGESSVKPQTPMLYELGVNTDNFTKVEEPTVIPQQKPEFKTGNGVFLTKEIFEPLPEEEKKKSVVDESGEYVWYQGIDKDLYDATRNRRVFPKEPGKDEDEEAYEKTKSQAVARLKEKIDDIEILIEKNKDEIYWASRVLNGDPDFGPWHDREQALNFLRDDVSIKKPEVKIKERKEKVEVKEGVWYEGKDGKNGILEDLKTVLYPNWLLETDEENARAGVAQKLRDKGIKLGELNVYPADKGPYENRVRIKSAVEFLWNKDLVVGSGEFKTRDEAVAFLRKIRIGNGAGVDCLPDSPEAKAKEQKKAVENGDEKGKAEFQRRIAIYDRLIDLTEFGVGGDKENLVSLLEEMGVKNIRKFMGDLEKMGESEKKEIMVGLRNVVDVWMMESTEKLKYPEMIETAKLYARELGLE